MHEFEPGESEVGFTLVRDAPSREESQAGEEGLYSGWYGFDIIE